MSIPISSELSRFNRWNIAKRFLNMSITDSLRRYKYRIYFAYIILLKLKFCERVLILIVICQLRPIFILALSFILKIIHIIYIKVVELVFVINRQQ